MKGTQAQGYSDINVESAIAKLRDLSQESQYAVVSIIERLALAEGVSGHADYKLPVGNIEVGVAVWDKKEPFYRS